MPLTSARLCAAPDPRVSQARKEAPALASRRRLRGASEKRHEAGVPNRSGACTGRRGHQRLVFDSQPHHLVTAVLRERASIDTVVSAYRCWAWANHYHTLLISGLLTRGGSCQMTSARGAGETSKRAANYTCPAPMRPMRDDIDGVTLLDNLSRHLSRLKQMKRRSCVGN